MKALYKLVIFLAIFQFSVLIINSTGVFPASAQLYSDVDTQELENYTDNGSAFDIMEYFFGLPEILGLRSVVSGAFTFAGVEEAFTFPVVIFLFVVVGALIAKATHSLTPMAIALLGLTFVPMISNSLGFVKRLFYMWDSNSVVYVFVALSFGIVVLALITVVETATHGDA